MLFILLAATSAAALGYYASDPYPGVTVDSGEYLAVAEGFVDGNGLTMPYVNYDEPFRVLEPGERVPMTQFPPGYPLLLAAVHAVFGLSSLAAARAIGLVCYAGTACLVAVLLWRNSKTLFPPALGVAFLSAPDLMTIHAMAWSEAPLIVLSLGCVAFISRYLDAGARRNLMLAGLCAALATAARLAGVATGVGVSAVLLFQRGQTLPSRLVRATAFLAASCAPAVAWFVRNTVLLGTPSEKQPSWHPPGVQAVARGVESIGGWFVPGTTLALVAGLAVVVAATIAGYRYLRAPRDRLTQVCIAVSAAYVAFLLAVITILDRNVALDTRILAPLQVLALVAVCNEIGRRRLSPRHSTIAFVMVLVAVLSVARGVDLAHDFSSSRYIAYTGTQWRSSETLAYASRVPSRQTIITNAPDPIWLWHGGSPQLLPPMSNLYTGKVNLEYDSQLRAIASSLSCGEGVVVFFDNPTRKTRRYIHPTVIDALSLTKIERFADGEVYDVNEPSCPKRTRGMLEKGDGGQELYATGRQGHGRQAAQATTVDHSDAGHAHQVLLL